MFDKTTMGFADPIVLGSVWNTERGHERFVNLIRVAMQEMFPDSSVILVLVKWDDEIKERLLSCRIPAHAQLDPAPVSVQQAAIVQADIYVTRWRMRNHLADMRVRTAVALQPRGEWDDQSDFPELMHQTHTNQAYSRYLQRFHS